MYFNYLDKDGLKWLRNVFCYLIDEELIKNKGNRTKLKKIKNRSEWIIDGIIKLEEKDRDMVIKDIKRFDVIIREISRVFTEIRLEDDKCKKAYSFLSKLMKNINKINIKCMLFKACLIQDPYKSMNIIEDEINNECKQLLIDICIDIVPETLFVYSSIMDIKLKDYEVLVSNELIDSIYYFEKQYKNKNILGKLLKKYNKCQQLIDFIQEKMIDRDNKAIYILAKNVEIIQDKYDIIEIEKLKALKSLLDIYNHKNNKNITEKIKDCFQKYDLQVVVFCIEKLIEFGEVNYDIISFFFHFLEQAISSFTNEQINLVNKFIINNFRNMPYIMQISALKLLKNKNLKDFIVDIVNIIESNFSIHKSVERKLLEIIKITIISTDEYKAIDAINNKGEIEELNIDNIDTKILVLCLDKFLLKDNINILRKLKQINKQVYYRVIENIQDFVIKKYIDEDKYIKIFALDEFKVTNNYIQKKCNEFIEKRSNEFETIIKLFDNDMFIKRIKCRIFDLIDKDDIMQVKKLLSCINDSKELQNIFDEILFKLSKSKKINYISKIWEAFDFNISAQATNKSKVKNALLKNECSFNDYIYDFIIDLGIDDIDFYNSLKIDSNKSNMLNKWNEYNKSGRISDVIKQEIIDCSNSLLDLEKIRLKIKEYQLKNNSVEIYLKISVYRLLEIKLLEVDFFDRDIDQKLQEIIYELIKYNLEERLINDIFLLEKLNNEIVGKIFRLIIQKSNTENILKILWNKIENDIDKKNEIQVINQFKLLLPFITTNSKNADWFLDTLEKRKYNTNIIILFLEVIFEEMNKNKKIINQYENDLNNYKNNMLIKISKEISQSLSTLEKTVVNMKEGINKDICMKNLIRLRKDLQNLGICAVEDIDSFGKKVSFNPEIHKFFNENCYKQGKVESLGIKVDNEIIEYSELNFIVKEEKISG